MISSPGSTARRARTTVSPPTPESNPPIARRLYVLSCPNLGSRLRRPVTPGGRDCHALDGSHPQERLTDAGASEEPPRAVDSPRTPRQAAETSQVYRRAQHRTG